MAKIWGLRKKKKKKSNVYGVGCTIKIKKNWKSVMTENLRLAILVLETNVLSKNGL